MTGDFASCDPASGEEIGRFPIDDPPAVAEAVRRARPAAAWWAGLGYVERERRLRGFAATMARRIHELAELIHRENGKPVDDGLLEAVISIDHVRWAARHARAVLGRSVRAPGLLMANMAASVEYHPYGVVAVIGPWNYPLFTPMGSIAYALAAGNAVIFKPSEFTPAIGRWVVDVFAESVPEQPVLQLATGFADTGSALVTAGVDKVAFTGSSGTAKKVLAACAENLTPALVECGGNDPLVVAADADIDAAVDAALWGGFSNAGQTCVGVERVFVVDPVYDEFAEQLTARAREIKAGTHYGPMTMPGQIDVIRRHIADLRGGRATVGGPESIRPPYVEPVILLDVPDDAPASCSETFGPTLTVHRVSTVDEAIERINAGSYALGAAVFSRADGESIARRIRAGMVAVNSVVSFVAVPSLPFGGVRNSGFGRIHGPEGLREFAWAQAISRQRFPSPLPVMTFRRTKRSMKLLIGGIRRGYGRPQR